MVKKQLLAKLPPAPTAERGVAVGEEMMKREEEARERLRQQMLAARKVSVSGPAWARPYGLLICTLGCTLFGLHSSRR